MQMVFVVNDGYKWLSIAPFFNGTNELMVNTIDIGQKGKNTLSSLNIEAKIGVTINQFNNNFTTFLPIH